jgi:hypothetical protein
MTTAKQKCDDIFARDMCHVRIAAKIVLAIGLLGMGGAIGFTRSMETRTYELVQFVGEESDIIDYDLSALDCGTAARRMLNNGLHVACEVAR